MPLSISTVFQCFLFMWYPGLTCSYRSRRSSAKSGSHFKFTVGGTWSRAASANILPPTLNTRTSGPNAVSQDGRQILNSDTLLLHRIAIAQRDCVAQRRILFAECLEINGHTERRTDFVLPAVSPTDRAALVVENS